MKLQKLFLVLMVFAITFGLNASPSQEKSGSQKAAPRPNFISIGTASAAGAYYPLGVAMANIWNKNIQGIKFNAQETGGGVANMNMLHNNEIEVGIANENIAYDAMKGNPPFKQQIKVQGGWVLNDSMAVLVALKKSGIKKVSDLRGKKVAIGAPGSSANVFGKLILKAEGIEENQFTPTFLGWQESADALSDGFVDAALMVGGQPFPAITSLALRTPVTILQFDTEKFRKLSTYPYTGGKIPAAMYKSDEDGDAVVIRSIVYLSPKLPEDLVYEMVKTIFANIPALAQAHPSGNQTRLLSKKEADEISLEIHPGVIRYAKEVGKW
ncbi:MAG: TAXI family TRAP transporter solute-binding subunit [Spirochaetes bacterium]|nr:TAXI family TRAP transporter solute-binding subunit [Spirochaetota bacterium]